ncbi:MAG: type I DNA topoisomerase [Planctomycetota bacterium]
MKLVIVESPNKTRKIGQFLGSDYRVGASFGHVRDLPPSGDLAITFADGRIAPRYQELERSARHVAQLRQLAERAEEVYLATDPDREGEAIAWHVTQVLGDAHRYRRIVFNAVTRAAVDRALQAPRELDDGLVAAQQARRVLDRVVGWVVSPVLRWGVGRKDARSAGRVQSVALRLVAEREREIAAFSVTEFFTLDARLAHPDTPPPFTARLSEWKGDPLGHRLAERALAESTVTWCRKQEWRVHAVDSREQQRRPPPPFITATVQQAASVRLGLPPDRTMQLLQKLFEDGHITYHRTDSVAIDPEAIERARAFIAANFPPDYLPRSPVIHQGKSANSQEAHEAIRPTTPEGGPRPAALGDAQARSLYELIWQRFIASQMSPGRDHLSTIQVAIAPDGFTHTERGRMPMGIATAKGKMVVFDGWRRLTDDATDERATGKRTGKGKGKAESTEESTPLPALTPGDLLRLDDLQVTKRSTKAPPRYTQASLIKKLEAEGIGRPSTYAAIMKTLLDRGYVTQQKRKLLCTELGLALIDFLVDRFAGNFIEYDYTARMEALLDRIAAGEVAWEASITEAAFAVRDIARRAGLRYDPLSGETAPRREPPQPCAEAGPCPLCQGPMTRREGRYGAFFACMDRGCVGTRNPDGTPGRKSRALLAERTPRPPSARPAPPPADPQAPACPLCGGAMALSTDAAGTRAWACLRFPACQGTAEA